MKLDIIVAIVAFINTIGFYTGQFDWLLIYYGCAPAEIKDKADRSKILGAASITNVLVFSIVVIDIMIRLLGYEGYTRNSLLWVCLILTLVMIVYTYIQTNVNLLNKIKTFVNKVKSPSNIKKAIEDKNAHDELVANRAEKQKIKEQKREEYLKLARIRSKSRH